MKIPKDCPFWRRRRCGKIQGDENFRAYDEPEQASEFIPNIPDYMIPKSFRVGISGLHFQVATRKVNNES